MNPLDPSLLLFIQQVTKILHADHHDDDKLKTIVLHLAKVQEELGELSHEVLGLAGAQRDRDYDRDQSYDGTKLAKECVDVILSTLVLMEGAGIDHNAAIRERLTTIQARFNLTDTDES